MRRRRLDKGCSGAGRYRASCNDHVPRRAEALVRLQILSGSKGKAFMDESYQMGNAAKARFTHAYVRQSRSGHAVACEISRIGNGGIAVLDL
jgi:hypothetical protein